MTSGKTKGDMKERKQLNQRVLQLLFGLGLIVFVIFIEFIAIHPPGIYSYTQRGYKAFAIGLSKANLLQKINKKKTIRTIQVCNPDGLFELTSRRHFQLENDMISSDSWICRDKTGKIFMFLFKDGRLERVLLQRLRFFKNQGSVLFDQCRPDLLADMDSYLDTQEKLTVFSDSDSRSENDE